MVGALGQQAGMCVSFSFGVLLSGWYGLRISDNMISEVKTDSLGADPILLSSDTTNVVMPMGMTFPPNRN